MTVTVTSRPVQDGRIYRGIPKGIKPWSWQGKATGDAGGGQINLQCAFNLDSLVSYQPYVSFCSFNFNTAIALAISDVGVFASQGHWERAVLDAVFLEEVNIRVTAAATSLTGAHHDTIYLGRSQKGTQALITARVINVDTMVFNGTMSGFVSDRPFMAQDYWRV